MNSGEYVPVAKRYVYVVDDDQDVLESMVLFLGMSGYHACPYSDGRSFIDNLAALRPGCVLLDVRMPNIDGFEVLAAMAGHHDRLATIVMTGHGDVSMAVRAMKSGAVDFIEKPFEEELLLRMLLQTFDSLAHSLENVGRRAEAAELINALTAREREVLEGITSGFLNKTIAHNLGIGVRTVEMHRLNLMKKLAARSQGELLRLSMKAGLLTAS